MPLVQTAALYFRDLKILKVISRKIIKTFDPKLMSVKSGLAFYCLSLQTTS